MERMSRSQVSRLSSSRSLVVSRSRRRPQSAAACRTQRRGDSWWRRRDRAGRARSAGPTRSRDLAARSRSSPGAPRRRSHHVEDLRPHDGAWFGSSRKLRVLQS